AVRLCLTSSGLKVRGCASDIASRRSLFKNKHPDGKAEPYRTARRQSRNGRRSLTALHGGKATFDGIHST
ncbi:MAG: hypothetical protein M3R52_00365, partial [Acidobacteriota bacterium]|nr:hypothetical protein [Acidobacteriota bacterium]